MNRQIDTSSDPLAGAQTPGSTPAPERRLVSSATRGTKIKRLFWSAVQSTLFRCSFHTMNQWRSFLLRTFGARVGKNCIIRRTVRVYYPWNLTIGNMCILGDKVELYSLGKITIGDRAMISQEAYLCAGTHDYRDLGLPLLTPPVVVEEEAWVCARAFVGPGVTVRKGAVLAACAVAVKDIPEWTVFGGNPAAFIKKRELHG